MIDELKLIRDRDRGARFKTFLEHDDVKKTIKALEFEYFKKFVATQAHEHQYREQIYRQMNSLSDLLRHLQGVASAGKLAQRHFDELEEKARLLGTNNR